MKAPRTEHVVAGGSALVVGAARFVPLPLVDDWLASLSRRQLVKSLLTQHGRGFRVGDLAALYNDGSLWGLPWRMVKNVVTFPVRKILKPILPFLLVRDVTLAMGRTLALAHVLDRQLRLGFFRDDETRAQHRDEARRLRVALDGAWAGVDQRLLKGALDGLWRRVRRDEVSPELEGLFAELDRRVDERLAGLV